MAFTHSRHTIVTIDGEDISPFTKNTAWNDTADSHDVTCYGKSRHVYEGGLGDGKCTISGVYDDGATGPRAIIKPLVGTVVVFVWKPEGAGTGKPGDTVDVLVTAYNESSVVADKIMWSAELQMSDDLVTADQ